MLYRQINSIDEQIAKNYIEQFKIEDAPNGDVTGESIFSGDEKSLALVHCKSETVLSGVALIALFFDQRTQVKVLKKDGDKLAKGDIIAEISGPSKDILRMERLFLNLLQRMCGISFIASKMAEIAKPFGVEILDTRKTTPGLRIFEKYAVYAGGGTNHRYTLSEGILIKDNHIAAAGSIKGAIQKVRKANLGLPLEIEIDTFAQLGEALESNVDAVLLDNFTPSETKKAVIQIRSHTNGAKIYVESSGGIDLNNLPDYVDTGINAVSSGALTHSVKSADISLDFKEPF